MCVSVCVVCMCECVSVFGFSPCVFLQTYLFLAHSFTTSGVSFFFFQKSNLKNTVFFKVKTLGYISVHLSGYHPNNPYTPPWPLFCTLVPALYCLLNTRVLTFITFALSLPVNFSSCRIPYGYCSYFLVLFSLLLPL